MAMGHYDDRSEFRAIAAFVRVNASSRESYFVLAVLLAFFATVIDLWKVLLIAGVYVVGAVGTEVIGRRNEWLDSGDIIAARQWRNSYLPWSCICGIAWGLMAILTDVPDQMEYQALGLLALTFMVFSNLTERSGDWPIFRSYHVTIFALVGAAYLWQLATDFSFMRLTITICFCSGMHFIYNRARFLHEQQWSHIDLAVEAQKAHEDVQAAYQRLEEVATTDGLTQLNNRGRIESALGTETDRATRYNHDLSVMLLDIDHFKWVNDNHGHPAGDVVLQTVATIIKETIRGTDWAGRWGGEEFMVLCPEAPEDDAQKLAERIRANVAGHDFGQIGQITVSLGLASFHSNDSAETLLKRADLALYQAKHDGRNRVSVAPASQVLAPA